MKQSESKSVEKWRRRSILKTVDGRKDGRTTDATPWHKLIGSIGPDELIIKKKKSYSRKRGDGGEISHRGFHRVIHANILTNLKEKELAIIKKKKSYSRKRGDGGEISHRGFHRVIHANILTNLKEKELAIIEKKKSYSRKRGDGGEISHRGDFIE